MLHSASGRQLRLRLCLGEAIIQRISRAADGADRILLAAGVEQFAQAADVDVDGALVDIDVAAPDAVEQLLAAEDAAGMFEKEFKQAVLSATSATVVAHEAPLPAMDLSAARKPTALARPIVADSKNNANTSSPVAAVAANGAPTPPRFTSDETILLRGLASGASSKEMATQMRLPRESLYRLIGDLRCKTGAKSSCDSGMRVVPTISPPLSVKPFVKAASASWPWMKSLTAI